MNYSGNILVADDEKEIVEIVVDALSELGKFRFITANDGATAIRKAQNQKFNLICTDFRMPNVSGAKLVALIREAPYNSNVPIIIFTAHLDSAKKECSSLGVQEPLAFFEKPLDENKLLATAKQFLDDSRGISQVGAKSKEQRIIETKEIPKLDVDFINPFIDATILTIKTIAQVEDIKAEKPTTIPANQPTDADISGCLSIAAPLFRGNFQVSFPNATFLQFVSRMLGESIENVKSTGDDKAVKSEFEDAVLELTNIIYGHAKTSLSKFDYHMERAIPSIIKGANHSVGSKSNNPSIIIPFSSSIGSFFISISLD